MAIISKLIKWCKGRWQWLVLTAGALIAFMLGSRRQRSLKIDAELERDQSKKELELEEKVRREENKKIIKAELKYKEALNNLESKYNDAKSDLSRDKDKEYKKMFTNAKDDPEKLNNLLKDLGISEVKK